jgi:hypothetical protein
MSFMVASRAFLFVCLRFFLILAGGLALSDGVWATEVIDIGTDRELFVDEYLLAEARGVELQLGRPRAADVSVRVDKPWEGAFNGGVRVFRYRGLFHMYYRGMTAKPGDPVVYCHATSTDGITWTKPEVGLSQVAGTMANNVIVNEDGAPLEAAVFVDLRPGIAAEERFKAVRFLAEGQAMTPTFAGSGQKKMEAYVSADGVQFQRMEPQPNLTSTLSNAFDSDFAVFWSVVEEQYVAYFRFMDGQRTVARTTSKDFMTWTDAVPMTYGGTPREHIYTNNTSPYFRAPHIYISLAARFMPGRRVIGDEDIERIGLANLEQRFYYHKDCSDAVLMTTRAGTTEYDRTFMEAFVRPGLGANNWVSRTNYPLAGIVQTGDNEMSFYVSRHYATTSWHVMRYTLRLDGFASMHAPYAGGEFVTKPLTFSGTELELNYSTSAPGYIRIEIQEEDGAPVPGYSLEDFPELVGDMIDGVAAWRNGPSVEKLVGETVRLRFVMKDADLYSIRFR